MPVLTPGRALGGDRPRSGSPRSSTSRDRNGRHFVLPLTHEETVTFHAREIQSYKQLPQLWYHFQTKDRDEPRPRGGLLRVREFIMKDSYSFDRDEDGRRRAASRATAGPTRRIFERCGIEAVDVQAESGIMGGKFSVDFLAPSGSGENTLVTCENGDYAADLEIAHARAARARASRSRSTQPEEIETPGVDDDRGARRVPRRSTRARPRRRCPSSATTARSCSRSCAATTGSASRSSSTRSQAARGPRRTRRSARRSAPAAARSARSASRARSSPTRRCARGSSSPARTATAGTCAASRPAATTSRGSPTSASRARATRCPNCGGALRFQTAIEVGHIFNFGSFYSEPLGATFLDEDGDGEAAARRQLRDRPRPRDGRRGRAAPRRARNPLAAPRSRRTMCTWSRCAGAEEIAERAAAALEAAGQDVLLDDRDQRAGEKFADADLIGIPVRVTVGKKSLEDGAVDVRDRSTGEERPRGPWRRSEWPAGAASARSRSARPSSG